MKNKKILLNGILTFLPTIIFMVSIPLINLLTIKDFNKTNSYLILMIVIVLCVIIGIISTCMNVKLNNKIFKIIFSIISVLQVVIGIMLVPTGNTLYHTSKNYDRIINNYTERIKQETYSNLGRWVLYYNYKNGDLISSDNHDVLDNELEDNNVNCEWYVEINDIKEYKINVNIQCTAFSENFKYFYKSKDFNNELLEKLKAEENGYLPDKE